MAFWAVGVGLMDARFGLGAALCTISIAWTVWLYWSELLTIPKTPFKAWPWLGILLIVIEILVPGYLVVSKAWGAPIDQAKSIQLAPPQPLLPQPQTPAIADSDVCPKGTAICIKPMEGGQVKDVRFTDPHFCNLERVLGMGGTGTATGITIEQADTQCRPVIDDKTKVASPSPDQNQLMPIANIPLPRPRP
jgi:hypothetical protein